MKGIEFLPEASGIYLVKNLINSHGYIGQSVNIKKRFINHHCVDYKNPKNCCYNTKFYQALRKYGLENFSIQILELCPPSELDQKEIYYIGKYDTYNHGYNSTVGGQEWTPLIHSEETERKRKQTLSQTQALMAENHPRAKMSNEEVLSVRQRYINGETVKSIYEDYKNLYSNEGTFRRIILGKSYKSVASMPTKEEIRYTNAKLTSDQVKELRNKYSTKMYSYAALGREYGISGTSARNIVTRKTYQHVL